MLAKGQNEYSIPFSFSLSNGELIETNAQHDLGGSFDYLVSYPEEHHISFPPEVEEKVLGYGVQGELIGHRFNGGGINVAGFMLEGLSGEFVRQKSGNSSYNVIIGFNILSRFNNILAFKGFNTRSLSASTILQQALYDTIPAIHPREFSLSFIISTATYEICVWPGTLA